MHCTVAEIELHDTRWQHQSPHFLPVTAQHAAAWSVGLLLQMTAAEHWSI